MDVYHSRSQCMTTAKIVCMFSCALFDGSVSAKDLMNGAETSIHDMRDVYETASQWFEPKTFLFYFLYYMIFSFRDSSSGMDPASAKAEVRSARCSVVNCGSCVWMTSRRSSTNRAWRNSCSSRDSTFESNKQHQLDVLFFVFSVFECLSVCASNSEGVGGYKINY